MRQHFSFFVRRGKQIRKNLWIVILHSTHKTLDVRRTHIFVGEI